MTYELPERFRSRASRRAALADAKQRLEAERLRAGEAGGGGPEVDAGFEMDAEALTRGRQGRRGWLREGRRQLDEDREREVRPIARSRAKRLEDAKRRLEEQLAVEVAANDAYEGYRARGVASDGRRFGKRPDPYMPPVLPEGRVNVTDPDSRVMRTQGQPTVQGYNAQAAVTAGQIIVAAEIAIESPGLRSPRAGVQRRAARSRTGRGDRAPRDRVIADAGYWHKLQMESIVSDGTQILIPPDSSLKENPRVGWAGGLYDFMRRVLLNEHGREMYVPRQETIEPVFGHTKHNRGFRQFRRRGRSAARSQWRFVAATHNLHKLHNHWIAATT
jgi:Transposase DDE domain